VAEKILNPAAAVVEDAAVTTTDAVPLMIIAAAATEDEEAGLEIPTAAAAPEEVPVVKVIMNLVLTLDGAV
jgi:hypothetical protein